MPGAFFFHLSLLLNPFIIIIIIIAASDGAAYTPTEHIVLDCGSSTKSSTPDGRTWNGDAGTKFSPNIGDANVSFAATATEQDPSITQRVPYMTARIILSPFSYTFPVTPGRKFLRLFFYPATYASNLDKTQSSFTVTANNYNLVSNFRAYLTVSSPGVAYFFKEFMINVEDTTQSLNVTFLPSPNSYAFVNGIEVVSSPDGLYMGSHDINLNPLMYVGTPNTIFYNDLNSTAFETLYRLNVGGQSVSASGDTGMFRQWDSDDKFIWGETGNSLQNSALPLKYTSQTPNYSAPAAVYYTARATGSNSRYFNLTWTFPVDSGFYYLLRLHFCEINPDIITTAGQRVFTILINNMTAEQEADVIRWTGGPGIPVFRDFAVLVPNASDGRQSRPTMFLALQAKTDYLPQYADALLNGLEIFKLSGTGGDLAGPNPEPVGDNANNSAPNANSQEQKRKGNGRTTAIIAAVAGGVAVILLLLGLLIHRGRSRAKDFDRKSDKSKSSWAPLSTSSRSTKTTGSGGGSSLPSDLCRRFLLEEIKSATSNFDETFVIGTGGFGNVYKSYIDNGLTAVAIKRLNPSSSQGAHEFRTEIEMLSNLRHHHLVSLIGYCDERGEMILVYDYMANGTLRDHLYRMENLPLSWKQRLQVCIGAAKGLHYLHSGAKHSVIHRDVKSTNILLDEKWVAKVSDFGLSKLGPSGGVQSHVSTQVKGSFGYVDPEYYKRQQLTEKSDVYSFGVVLMEVLCARPAIVPNSPREQMNLAEWARRCYRKGVVDQIVDPNVKGEIAPECLRSYSEIAINCLRDEGIHRPGMSDVVWSLEFALQLQEAADKEGDRRRPPPAMFPYSVVHGGPKSSTEDDSSGTEAFFRSGDQDKNVSSGGSSTDKLKSDDGVFSEIMNPVGR